MVTRMRESRIFSISLRNFSLNEPAPLNFSFATSSRCSITVSKSPMEFNTACADLSPIPVIPGTLSTLSPFRVRKSLISSGGTPNFSITPARSSTTPLMVSSIRTFRATSCARSLSPDSIIRETPCSSALTAYEPSTSSASTPGTSINGYPEASINLRIHGSWLFRSSGIGFLVALYSG